MGSSVSGEEEGSRDWRSVAKKVRSAVEGEEERRLADVDGRQVQGKVSAQCLYEKASTSKVRHLKVGRSENQWRGELS